MAGYSATPLWKKLGFRPGCRILLIGAPEDYLDWVAPLPESTQFATRIGESIDIVHLFTHSRIRLDELLQRCRAGLRSDAVVWVSWPKRASRVPTDITEDTIRELALPIGFVDIKVCAVSEVWSGLKLMLRKSLR